MLSKCTETGQTEDLKVRASLAELTLSCDLEVAYVTLLAIYVLQEGYEDWQGEW